MVRRSLIRVVLMTLTGCWLGGCVAAPVAYLHYEPKPHFSDQVELVRNPVAALEASLQTSIYEYTVHGEAMATAEVVIGPEQESRTGTLREPPTSYEHEEGSLRIIYSNTSVVLTYAAVSTFEIRRGVDDGALEVDLRNQAGALLMTLFYSSTEQVHLLIDALAVLNPKFVQHPNVPGPA